MTSAWRGCRLGGMSSAAKITIRLATLAAISLLGGCGVRHSGPTPNVILIVVDTLRADRLSQYGYELDTSPGLEALASRATLYEKTYAPASWTTPSTVSILSGLWPPSHGTGTRRAKMSPQVVSLAEVLQERGWETAAFSHNISVSRQSNYDQGFDHFAEHDGGVLEYPDVSEIVRDVQEWLAGRRNTQRPFFLYLQPMNVHGPYRVPESERGSLLGRPPGPGFSYYADPMAAIMKGDLDPREEVTEEYLTSLRETYDQAVRYTTDQIGRLLEELGEEVVDEALVIVTSDHGEELYEHEGFAHAYSVFEEVVRVPLIVKEPGQMRAARLSEAVSLVDIYPTVLDLLEIRVRHQVDGLPLPLTGGRDAETDPDRAFLFGVHWEKRARAEAIQVGGLKLIDVFSDYQSPDRDYQSPDRRVLVFELEEDPGERTNLIELRRDIVKKLRRRKKRLLSWHLENGFETVELAEDEMDHERLRALGYID